MVDPAALVGRLQLPLVDLWFLSKLAGLGLVPSMLVVLVALGVLLSMSAGVAVSWAMLDGMGLQVAGILVVPSTVGAPRAREPCRPRWKPGSGGGTTEWGQA